MGGAAPASRALRATWALAALALREALSHLPGVTFLIAGPTAVAASASTVTGLLRRNGVARGTHGGGARRFIRFEHAAPNHLWQMGVKGDVALRDALDVLDDPSRFALVLAAGRDNRRDTVQTHLIAAFRRYGMPRRMAMDNGPPRGSSGHSPCTRLTVRLIAHDVTIRHSRPRHLRTLGKQEPVHRARKAGAHPDKARAMATPITRCRQSRQGDQDIVPAFDHGPGACEGQRIAFRPTPGDGTCEAWFRHRKIRTTDLTSTQR